MTKKIRALAAVAMSAALLAGAAITAATPAQALPCRNCDGNGGDGGNGGGDGVGGSGARSPLPWQGTGGPGNAYAWNGVGAGERYVTVEIRTSPIDGHHAWWMKSKATLDKTTGTVQITDTIQDDQWFGGFTGGTHVSGLDDYGNTLCQTSIEATPGESVDPRWGVVGKYEIGASSRPLTATLQCHGNSTDVTRLEIHNWHNARNRLSEVLAKINEIINTVKNGVDAAKKIEELTK
jgi:hypothetical protein